jgi:hypothetical protein
MKLVPIAILDSLRLQSEVPERSLKRSKASHPVGVVDVRTNMIEEQELLGLVLPAGVS